MPEMLDFSPVGSLIKASWERVKLIWKNLVLLYLIIYGVIIGAGLVMTTVILGGGAMSAFTNPAGFEAGITQALTTMAPVAILMLLLFILLMIAVGSIVGAAMIRAVAQAEAKPAIGTLLSEGKHYFVPLFLTGLLVGFLTIGGMFVFVIPGLIIAIFMSFANYEVVLQDQKPVAAMKNSATIIKQNFGPLFTRWLVVVGLAIGISIIDSILASIFKDAAGLGALYGLVSMVIQAIFGFFILAYTYLVYKEARAMVDLTKPASLTWMWVVSALGWLLGILLFALMGAGIAALLGNQEIRNQFEQELQKEGIMPDSTVPLEDGEQLPSLNFEEGQLDTEALIEQYGSELSDEEKQMLRDFANSAENGQ